MKACKHGNNPRLGACPQCCFERDKAKRLKADRKAFQDRLRKIRGEA